MQRERRPSAVELPKSEDLVPLKPAPRFRKPAARTCPAYSYSGTGSTGHPPIASPQRRACVAHATRPNHMRRTTATAHSRLPAGPPRPASTSTILTCIRWCTHTRSLTRPSSSLSPSLPPLVRCAGAPAPAAHHNQSLLLLLLVIITACAAS